MPLVCFSGVLNGLSYKGVGLFGMIGGFLRVACRQLPGGLFMMRRCAVAARCCAGMVLGHFRGVFHVLLHFVARGRKPERCGWASRAHGLDQHLRHRGGGACGLLRRDHTNARLGTTIHCSRGDRPVPLQGSVGINGP